MFSKNVTVMIVPEGTESGKEFRIKQWLLKFIIGFIIFLVVGIILFFSFYGEVLSRATLTDKLKNENEQLLRYQYKVKLLEQNLIQARELVSRLVKLAGIDYEFPELPSDSAIFAELDKKGKAILTRSNVKDLSFPSGQPLQGFISQDFNIDDSSHYHPGVDFAVAEGTPVLATGNGEIVFAGFDDIYGYMIVIKHSDSVETIYGHNRELLVKVGGKVLVGSRIALSGNTGNSSAPHLHYELRINNNPINPLEN